MNVDMTGESKTGSEGVETTGERQTQRDKKFSAFYSLHFNFTNSTDSQQDTCTRLKSQLKNNDRHVCLLSFHHTFAWFGFINLSLWK